MDTTHHLDRKKWSEIAQDISVTIDKGSFQKWVTLFIDRITRRYFTPIEILIKADEDNEEKENGFVILTIDCSLIETLESFRKWTSDSNRNSWKYFTDFLVREGLLIKEEAEAFYKHFRCWLLHQTEITWYCTISSKNNTSLNESWYFNINFLDFHEKTEKYFRCYIKELMDPTKSDLRMNFIKKMNSIYS